MSLRFTRFSETIDVNNDDHGHESIPNGHSTGDDLVNPKYQPITYLCQTKCRILIAIVIALLIIVSLVIGISFLVKCDEDKLIAHFETRRTTFEKAITDWAENHHKEKLSTEDSYKSEKVEWIPGSQFDENVMEPAGNEQYGEINLLLYVARASHLNGTVVGKYCPHLNKMFIGYDGEEIDKLDFELLSFPRGTLSWLHVNSTTLPNEEDLLLGGAAPITGESTFICRAKTKGHLFIGKFLESTGKCLAAYRNTELGLFNFEILTVNEMGRMIGVDA